MTSNRKLPIGIQDFEKLRETGNLYVDKTAYIYQLLNTDAPYFLSRPRRFGKSLFLSTLKAYFLGKKDLFEGLAIAEMEKDWVKYPVFHIDFVGEDYTSLKNFHSKIDANLERIENDWGKVETEDTFPRRLEGLIRRAAKKMGQKVVVLVDEYDKPLLETMHDEALNAQIRNELRGFYGVLKGADADLKFVFLTGVTKFSQVSVFSDLNQLQDISMEDTYAGICGISQKEMEQYFQPEIAFVAQKNKKSVDQTLAVLKKHYDGYHFSRESEDLYNPFSLLNTFAKGYLDNYWFATGTPTFLVHMLKNMDFDIPTLEKDVKASPNSIFDYRAESKNPIPLLYQTGYLTIKAFDPKVNVCTLGFPNDEVKYGFYSELLPVYMQGKSIQTEFFAWNFVEDLQTGNVEGFMTRIKAFFADIPYELENKTEKHYQTVFYLLFKLMGQFVETEVRSAIGRADAVVKTADTIFVFEFKTETGGTAEEALKQMDDKGYLIPYVASGRKIVKVGAEFSVEERNLRRWLCA